jgi:GH25 family lysozyme M1 (1,4-beta-N-acetylmuramidase)
MSVADYQVATAPALLASGAADRETLRALGLWSDVDYGLDVSHHQGLIDWARVARSGEFRWAAVKVTEGTGFIDGRGAENVRGAHAAGLEVGVYHFARGTAAAWLEAEKLEDALARAGMYHSWVVLDVEAQFTRTGENGREWIAEWLHRFPGSLIYTSARIVREKRLGDLSSLAKLWAPRYSSGTVGGQHPATTPWSDWTIWQYTDNGRVPGIDGACDLNVRVLR